MFLLEPCKFPFEDGDTFYTKILVGIFGNAIVSSSFVEGNLNETYDTSRKIR